MRGKTRLKRIRRGLARRAAVVRARMPGRPRATRTAAAPAPDRDELLKAPIDLAGHGLEIGPSHRPLLPKSQGYDVTTVDHTDREGLVAKYRTHGVNLEAIEEVDHVVTAGSIADQVDDRFDYVVASHLIEHTVCLVSFLQDCERLLTDQGVLTLAVPDKRWTFDRFRERTGLARIVDTYLDPPKVHTPGSLLEYHLETVTKDGRIAWTPDNTNPFSPLNDLGPDGMKECRRRMDLSGTGFYIDIHNWVFTPNHFRLLMSDLYESGYTQLRETYFHDTVGIEFFVGLSLDGKGSGLSRTELVTLSDGERWMDDAIAWAPRNPNPA